MIFLSRKVAVVWLAMAALSSAATAATPVDAGVSGTWSGSFDIHYADGRVVNDTAWLVLQQTGAIVTGTVGPKPDQQGPVREGTASGRTFRFVADTTPGKVLRFELRRQGERLSGEGNGEIGADRVRVILKTTRQSASAAAPAQAQAQAQAPTADPLLEKILAVDFAFFDAFNKCSDPKELEKHAAFFAKDVEFFHDLGGVTLGVDALMEQTRKNVCGKFRRELDRESFRAYPIPGYGAITIGTHRFCHTPATCEGAAEFTTVWREKDGAWQITRALSYAHRSL
jgi:hypothetical protein